MVRSCFFPVFTVLSFFMAGLLCTSSALIIGSLTHPAGGRPSHLISVSGSWGGSPDPRTDSTSVVPVFARTRRPWDLYRRHHRRQSGFRRRRVPRGAAPH